MSTKDSNQLPVIYLSFSNNQDAYLAELKEEAKLLYEILYPLHESKQYEIYREEGVDLNDLFNGFRRFRNRIRIFHYGGHADSKHLLLEGQLANSTGIAELFKTESDLKLIFLNGCSTKNQVEQLLENGIPAVIGTSVPIDDKAAVDFSKQFYMELASGSTLKVAFDVASAYLLSKYNKKDRPQMVTRGAVGIEWDEKFANRDEIPWGLFIAKGKEEILEWRLVEGQGSSNIDYESLKSVSFAGEGTKESTKKFEVNQYLVPFIFEGIKEWEPQEGTANAQEALLEMGLLKRTFPGPIFIELERLLTRSGPMTVISIDRLRQLIFTYHEATRFLAFTNLAQLIKIIKDQKVHLSSSNVLLTRFFGLNQEQSNTFDFLELANDIDQIFRDHEIEPWVKEQSSALKAIDQLEDQENIHSFMKKLFPLVLDEKLEIPEGLDLLWQQTEYCLGKLLREMAFFIRYEFVSLKDTGVSTSSTPSTKKGEAPDSKVETRPEFVYAPFSPNENYTPIPINDPDFKNSVRLIRDNSTPSIEEPVAIRLVADNIKNGLDLSYLLKDNIDGVVATQPYIFGFKSPEGHNFRASRFIPQGSYNYEYALLVTNEDAEYLFLQGLLDINEVKHSPKRFRYANYNSDVPDGTDHLDIMPDVRAFANLIASQELKPPLSIGIFGDWGSGKSFFMGKLKKEVAEYERIAKRELAKSADKFLLELEEFTGENERQKKVLSLFPDPKTQIYQIREWIKSWERKRDPSALRSLGRIFGVNPNEIEKMMLTGTLKEYTEESKLIESLVKSQQKEASNLASSVHKLDDPAAKLIRNLAELKAEPELGYCRNIAQIEFNAWHYIDTNLWASLITNILEDLNTYVGNLPEDEKAHLQLYKDLATTHKLKIEVENEIEEIQVDIKSIEEDLTELKKQKDTAEKELTNIRLKDAFEILIDTDENVKKIVNEIKTKGDIAYREIGLENFEINVKNAEKQVRQLEGDINSTWFRINAWILSFQDFSRRNKIFFVLFLIIPVLAFWILPQVLTDNPAFEAIVSWLKVSLDPFFQWAIPIFAFIAEARLVGQKMLGRIKQATDALDVAKSKLDKLQGLASSQHQKQIEAKEAELAEKQAELDKAEKKKETHGERIKKLEKDLAEIEGGKRLSAFIERRLLSDDYQQHLGLISLIREDFERLTSYLHDRGFYAKVINRIQTIIPGDNSEIRQENSPFDLEKIDTIDRIVLYIDDLDRCPPDKVVQVLQAIHLILAFPLFVVVVGVDVRWVSRSLAKEYGSMLSKLGAEPHQILVGHAQYHTELEMQFKGNATPFDYMEKIFQIPFQLKNLSNDDKEYLIGKLLEEDMKQASVVIRSQLEVGNPIQVSNFSSPTSDKLAQTKVNSTLTTTVEKQRELKETVKPVSHSAESGKNDNDVDHALSPKLQRLEKVSLNAREISFIKAMSPILNGSPRTVKRFVNVCRLIKSHAKWGKHEREMDGKLTDYETMIFILGLVTGIPTFTRFLFEKLELENQDKSFQYLIDQLSEQLENVKRANLIERAENSIAKKKNLENSSEKTVGMPIDAKIISVNGYLNLEDLLEEWESFQKVWRINKTRNGPLPKQDSNDRLIADFCAKKLETIKPLFKTAVRFSFRFTEY